MRVNIFSAVINEYEMKQYEELCNSRITASFPIFKMAGVNLPYLNVKRLLGEKLPLCELKTGKIVRRRWMEMEQD